jgi:hypothetical protein
MCWEYISAFENNPHRLELLQMSLLSLEQIQSSHIKQGTQRHTIVEWSRAETRVGIQNFMALNVFVKH